jgi:hypothetical protein
MIWLAFFFLLRPGKYIWTNSIPHPFMLKDFTFKIGTQAYNNAATIPLALLLLVTYVGMHYEQKNGIKNETIGLTCSQDLQACPVLVAACQVQHLCEHQMPAPTPLFIYFKQGVQHHITNRMITKHLRTAGVAINQPNDYTAGALQNTGAQSLLQAQVPLPMIKLIGRWLSDEVFRYLTARSKHLEPFAETMLCNAY